jgi:hypothetical protein
MPPQDVSANRNHGWSSDNTSSVEDYAAFSDSGRRLVEPERQPVNAPGSPGGCLQSHEGFVRFMRTHSPPTRQRATVGGRIVSIEPPSAPPQFRLPINNLTRNTIAPAVQNIGHNSVRRERRSETSSSTMYNELRNGSRKHFKPDANFPINRGTPTLPEPFPKFYDDQTGREDVQKTTTGKGKAIVNRNTDIESKTSQPDCQVSGIVQSTAHSINQAPERHAPSSTTSRAWAAEPRQARRSAQGVNSAVQGPANPYYPPGMQASQQWALNASQHMPNSISLALEGVSTARTPELAANAQVVTYPPLVKPFRPYPDLESGSHQAVSHPSLFPIVPQGYQVPPFASLPMYANQISLVPSAYYGYDPFNVPASLLSTIATTSLTDMPMPFTAPNTLDTASSEAPTQMQLQQELASVKANFENLTEQGRMLDQYLAMHMDILDPQTRRAWTDKRMQIVEGRAVAKHRVNQLQQALDAQIAWPTNVQSDYLSQMSLRSTAEARPISHLNVQAPPWVPKASADSKQVVGMRNPDCSTKTDQVTTSQRVPLLTENINRTKMTPLEHTTAVSEDLFAAKNTFVPFNPEKLPVDKWGTRLGPAPPELERLQSEQSEMLESMVSEASKHSTGPLGSPGNTPESDSSWEPRDGGVPPQVEADQKQYLDATRQDLGTASVLTMASGKAPNVEGQNYEQPRLKYMSSDFERDYWLRKPKVDQRVGTSHSRPLDRSFENIKPTPSPQKSKQTEEWVNDVVDFQKSVYSGRAPWITDGMNLLNTKGEPSIGLQNAHAMSKTRGINGAASHLRGRC